MCIEHVRLRLAPVVANEHPRYANPVLAVERARSDLDVPLNLLCDVLRLFRLNAEPIIEDVHRGKIIRPVFLQKIIGS